MENRQANSLDNSKDVKTGQDKSMKRDNAFYESYANMSAEEIKKLREKRNTNRASMSGQTLKTYVPESFKNPNLHYEWVIFDPIEMDRRLSDGWVIVENEKLAKLKGCSTTSQVKIPSGGKTANGEPEHLVLMAIHKTLYDDDVKASKKRIKELDDYINSGKIVSPDGKTKTEGIEVKEISIN